MNIDGHIHICDLKAKPKPEKALGDLATAGFGGAIIISLAPPTFFIKSGKDASNGERLENVMEWCSGTENLFPFYWIDPLEEKAMRQIEKAIDGGILGFKIICDRFHPGDKKAMKVYRAIAETGRPILFHSGILWDGKSSSAYNRPAEFEALLEVQNLRFSLAHISWPWCDELIALYGKFSNAKKIRDDVTCEMFVDTTPGTPEIYRRDALTKLFSVGYDVRNNVFFGSDSTTESYNSKWASEWISRDTEILKTIGLPDGDVSNIFGGNILKFIYS